MNIILSLQFYLASSSSPGPWPGALHLQLRDPNYGNGDTNTFSKRMFEQFTEYLTGWQICQLPVFWGLKTLQIQGEGASPPDMPQDPAGGCAPRLRLQPRDCKPPGLAAVCMEVTATWSSGGRGRVLVQINCSGMRRKRVPPNRRKKKKSVKIHDI